VQAKEQTMSIWTSLLTGSSGLSAFEQAISVVGDNISNVSTTGFRASRAGFEDVLGGTASNGQRNGDGVHMSGPETMLGQGAIQQTNRPLDMAIRGNGFFVLAGQHDGINGTYYSRDGRFALDKDGFVVNNEGLRVQGYPIDNQGVLSPASGDLRLDPQGAARPTGTVNLSVNLDPSSTPMTFDPANPTATSNYATSTTVYDSLGTAHRVDVYFVAQGNSSWEWHAMVDGRELTGGTPGTETQIANGTLTFDTNGALVSQTTTASSASFVNATPNQAIEFDFGDAIANGGTGLGGSTALAGASNVKLTSQDGYAAGTLSDLQIADDGSLTAVYSNGQSRPVARLALATFGAEGALRRAGGQLFVATADSGEPRIAAAATGGRGAIVGGSLEGSNVDIGQELVTLIAYQRAFQANARTVTTADEVLNELANIKR
jgi:flagellar hook protein FlgE